MLVLWGVVETLVVILLDRGILVFLGGSQNLVVCSIAVSGSLNRWYVIYIITQ